MDDLNILRRNKEKQKIELPPPYSERFQPCDMSLLDELLNYNPTKSFTTGIDYVQEYIKKEEQELLQVFYYFCYFILLYI